MIATPNTKPTTETAADHEDTSTVASIKLDNVTGGWWSPYAAWGAPYAAPYAAYSPRAAARFAAFEQRRATWYAANAPAFGPGGYAPAYSPAYAWWY